MSATDAAIVASLIGAGLAGVTAGPVAAAAAGTITVPIVLAIANAEMQSQYPNEFESSLTDTLDRANGFAEIVAAGLTAILDETGLDALAGNLAESCGLAEPN